MRVFAFLPRLVLMAGLILGAGLAVWHVLETPLKADAVLAEQAVARVGETLILRDEWHRAVATVASERRTPLTEEDREAILQRLVDEALLLQHGLDMGLVERVPRLRGQLVSEVMQGAIEARQDSVDERELARFHSEHMGLFQPPAQLQVQVWQLGQDGAMTPFQPPVPEALMPPGRLSGYIGPTLTREAVTLAESARSEPIRMNDKNYVIEMVSRQEAPVLPFSAVREEVLNEWRRRNDEAAVRGLLEELRGHYTVQIRP